MIFDIEPVAKPRMTQRDRWKKRPAVLRYRAFKDHVRAVRLRLDINLFYHVIFVLPMPKSWSEKKRNAMRYRPHQQKPDKDNLEKALLDAIFSDDAAAWDGRVTKVWGDRGSIIIATEPHKVTPVRLKEMLGDPRSA